MKTKTVKGKVTKISEKPLPDERISHHSPKWTEAIINTSAGNIKVKYSASTDVAWYKYPKLTVGQEGAFVVDEEGAVIGIES